MKTTGDSLIRLCQTAETELILVAPFMKENVVRSLVNELNEDVNLVCITRWRPEEIKFGVSDLGVWEVINQRANSRLLLMPTLHAKFYRSGENCLIGSANLTNRALGWSKTPNIELLVPIDLDEFLKIWEIELIDESVEANESIFHQMEKLVESLELLSPLPIDDRSYAEAEEIFEGEQNHNQVNWLPTLRYPDLLFKAYEGRIDDLTTGARISASQDLQQLGIPYGLLEPSFNAVVGAVLLQKPMIHRVDNFLEEPRRFGEVRNLLKSSMEPSSPYDPSESWQTLMRWLRYFLPERYSLSVPNYSEIVFRT